ncbi:MAG: hypothetical protein AAGH74_15365 [Pseudomonadota bacterium]
MNFDLSGRIAASAVTDELAESISVTVPDGNTKRVPLTPEERKARREEREEKQFERDEKAYNTDDGNNKAYVRAAFREETSEGRVLFEMGAGDDVFHFGNSRKVANRDAEHVVDMGAGENDVVRFANSIEDYTFSTAESGGITALNHKSGIEITFEGAEQFVFKNQQRKDGVKLDFEDTSFTVEEMLAIAGGTAQAEIAAAELIAEQSLGLLNIDPGEDGVYVNLSISDDLV